MLPESQPFSMVTAPNQLWCMDFKGYFLTGDGYRCDPFTITDAHQPVSDSLPGRDGMDLARSAPFATRRCGSRACQNVFATDNGAPFGASGLLGLSKLSLGWMKLGIVHERIQPGRLSRTGA